MTIGFERDGEISCICTITTILRRLAATYPDDPELEKAAQKARLVALTELARHTADLERRDRNIIEDRLNDCRRCKADAGGEPCRKDGRYIGCKYHKAKFAVMVAKRYFGSEVLTLFGKYVRIMRAEME